MGLGAVVDRVLGASRPPVIIECRHCGQTVDQDTEICPECDRVEFARYDLSEDPGQ